MTTLVRQFSNANFSDSVILDIEPQIAWPSSTLGAYRLKSSLGFSGTKKAGSWTAPVVEAGSGNAIDYEGTYIDYNAGIQLAIKDQLMPAGSLTFLTVDYLSQIGDSGAQWLTGANGYGLRRDTSSMSTVFRASGSDQISLKAEIIERWELIFGVYDDSSKTLSIYRPRDGELVSVVVSAAPSIPITAIRLSGNTDSVACRSALKSFMSEAMSKEGMDALYKSAKSALDISNILI